VGGWNSERPRRNAFALEAPFHGRQAPAQERAKRSRPPLHTPEFEPERRVDVRRGTNFVDQPPVIDAMDARHPSVHRHPQNGLRHALEVPPVDDVRCEFVEDLAEPLNILDLVFDDTEVEEPPAPRLCIQAVVAQEARYGDAADNVLPNLGQMGRSADSIAAGHDAHVVAAREQMLGDLSTPQLVPAMMVRRVQIRDDQDLHPSSDSGALGFLAD
jgi:hypothetical protein